MKKITAALVFLTVLFGCAGNPEPHIIPCPNHIRMGNGTFDVSGADFVCGAGLDSASVRLVNDFARHFEYVSGTESASSGRIVRFIYDGGLGDEAYGIDVFSRKVDVKASSYNGFLYAVETIRQMLPVSIYGDEPAPEDDWTLPCLHIDDAPRFGYRGMHLDVSRHFYDIDVVRRYIDMMAIHKMNVFHWHLTDDQGWRVESKIYPLLTEIGSKRKGTVIRKDWGTTDGIPHEGFYTQEEIREIVSYAGAKGITIIPEIDLPGHMLGVLAAYPELGCTGGPYEVWERWGISPDVLCAGKEETIVFLKNVLGEIADLFPGEYIHIGGDECPKVRWESCPVCQAKIRELGLEDRDGYTAEHYLQSHIMNMMEDYLYTRGKKIIGWDEILEGSPRKTATIMSWRGSAGGIEASKAGHDAIMVPNDYMYIDYYQSSDMSAEPFAIGGYVPVEKVYSYEPFTDEMDDIARKHIIGVQSNLWTEYIASKEHLEYMLLPRQAAVSEVQWCRPENKDWDRFFAGLRHEFAIYDILGYNYAKTIYEISGVTAVDNEKNVVLMTLSTEDNAEIRYTLDGSEPTAGSALYTAPVEIDRPCTLRARAFRDFMDVREYRKEFVENKALGRPVTVEKAPKFPYNFPHNLTDGLRGIHQFDTGEWAGWENDGFSVTVDMGGAKYGKVVLGCLSGKDEDIFPPTDVRVSISDDGEIFVPCARRQFALEGKNAPHGVVDCLVEFPSTTARYVRIEARTAAELPSWHVRAGGPVYLYVDEVIIKL